ncbi:unnamed protein product, partial [Ostreobium quekettii]
MAQQVADTLAAIHKALEYVPYVRYNASTIQFLCKQMEKVAALLVAHPDGFPQHDDETMSILTEEVKHCNTLIKRHGEPFRLQSFYKTHNTKTKVEEVCMRMQDCLSFLGLENEDIRSIRTQVDKRCVDSDKRRTDWFLACILEGGLDEEGISEEDRLNLEDQISKHRERLKTLNFRIRDEDVQRKERLGTGGFGEVYKGKWGERDVAIKILSAGLGLEARAEFLCEVEMHMRMSHPNVVRCHGAIYSKDVHAMVLELAVTDLLKLSRTKRHMNWGLKAQLMAGAAQGLKFLHDMGVVHRDVKAANFLVFIDADTGVYEVKIGDFGLARVKHETRTTVDGMMGTTRYIAPEVHEGGSHNYKTDVFSFGLLMYEIAAENTPYANLPEAAVLGRKRNRTDPCILEPDCPPDLKELMERCIEPVGSDRPTMQQVVAEMRKILHRMLLGSAESMILADIGSPLHTTSRGKKGGAKGEDVLAPRIDDIWISDSRMSQSMHREGSMKWEEVSTMHSVVEEGEEGVRPVTNGQQSRDEKKLRQAAVDGRADLVTALLEKGVNVDTRDKNGATPLCIASCNGHKEVASVLIRAGAKTDSADKDGAMPLYIASWGGHKEVVSVLLGASARVDCPNKNGATPLYVAAQQGFVEIADMLLRAGAKVDLPRHGGATPLCIAAQGGKVEVVKVLLRAGAMLDFPIE